MLHAHATPADTAAAPLAAWQPRRERLASAAPVLPQHAECFICRLRQGWLSKNLTLPGSTQPWLASGRKTVLRGAALFRAGDPMRNLYGVHAGQFKSSTTAADGRSQVTGFHVEGELLGLDAIGSGVHSCDALALEDAQVCVMPYSELSRMVATSPALQKQFLQLMSQQMVRDHQVMLWLGSLKAEERVASFLLDLTGRLHHIGYSASAVVLRMSREEIGSYLGVTLETVSRVFSKFRQDGLLKVKERDVRIVDRQRLMQLGCAA